MNYSVTESAARDHGIAISATIAAATSGSLVVERGAVEARPIERGAVETRNSWFVATMALLILAFAFGAPWVAVVALKAIAADFGGARSTPALAGSLAWIGVGAGGILMGRIAERIGVRWTVMFGCAMVCVGLAISAQGRPWQLFVGHGIFIGLIGNGGINAPLYVYVSKWFDRRRGSALALISSGTYVAGAIWPPIFERVIAVAGWQRTMWMYGLVELAVILPLAAVFLRSPPQMHRLRGGEFSDPRPGRVLGWPPGLVFAMLCAPSCAACRWPSRRRISSLSAPISASRPRMAPRCCRSCWAAAS